MKRTIRQSSYYWEDSILNSGIELAADNLDDDNYDGKFERSVYSFADYCRDQGISQESNNLRAYQGAWDIFRDDYIEFCYENELVHEELDDC